MKSWPLVPLRDLLQPISRPEAVVATEQYRLLGAHWYAQGLYIKDIKAGSEIQANQLYSVEAGDFVYNRLFAWKGSFALVGKDVHGCYVSNEFPCFRLREGRVDGRYLHYYFSRESIWNEALGLSSGGTPTSRNRLKEDRLLAMAMPLPPIEEQRRIVEWVEKLKSKVDEAVVLNQHSVELADVLFYLEAKRIRKALLSRESSRPMSEITRVCSGGTPDRSNPIFWQNGTIPWVKTGELCDNEIAHTEENITDEAMNNSSAKLFPPETVLIAMYGQGQTRGRTALLKVAATTNQACAAMLPQPSVFVSKYLQYWLRGLYHEMRMETRAGAQPNWNLGMIGRIAVVTPSLERQNEIVEHLDTLEQQINGLRRRQDETTAELRALMPSVLNHAFSGQL